MNAPTILNLPAIRQAALPISVEQYHAISEAGIVPERTELLDGVIIGQMTKSPLHTYLVQLLVSLISTQLPAGFYVRSEQPLTLSGSEPEPEAAIDVHRRVDAPQYRPVVHVVGNRHLDEDAVDRRVGVDAVHLELGTGGAGTRSVSSGITVWAISSEAIDRDKAAIYARGGIEEYWLILPDAKRIERFTEPVGISNTQRELVSTGMRLCSKTSPSVSIETAELFV